MIRKFIKKYIKKRILQWALKELIKEQQNACEKYTLRINSKFMLNDWHHFSMKQDDLFKKHFNVGHPIERAHDPLTIREFIFYAQSEVEAWCETSLNGRFYIFFDDDQYLYFIEDVTDATLFKLTWM